MKAVIVGALNAPTPRLWPGSGPCQAVYRAPAWASARRGNRPLSSSVRRTGPHRQQTVRRFEPTPFYDGNMIWEKDGSSLEIRTQGQLPDGKPALDEIVANGASLHLEQMAQDHWWMGLEAGGKHLHLSFGVQDRSLWVRLSDQDEQGAEWEGDSREKPIPGIED
jgi:hypothetical protein